MFAWVRMATAMGFLAAATALYGCGGSGGGSPAAGNGGPSNGQMPEPEPVPQPDEMSELSETYDMTPVGVDEMLPAGSTHLIEDIAAAQTRAGGTPLAHPRTVAIASSLQETR